MKTFKSGHRRAQLIFVIFSILIILSIISIVILAIDIDTKNQVRLCVFSKSGTNGPDN